MEIPKGFKKTDAGVISSSWDATPLDNISISIASGKSKTQSQIGGKFPIYGSTGVIGFSSKSDYDGNKILVARVGANAGTVNFVEGKYCVSDNTLMVQLNKETDFTFIFYFLKYANLNKLIFGSGQPLITGTQLKNLPVPLPPTKAEQTAIATALNDADVLITQLEKLIAKKRAIKQGAMQELLKPKKGWETKKLSEIGECIIGLTYSPLNVKKEGKLVLRSSNIKMSKLVYEDNVFVNVDVPERLITKKSDILICVRNGSRNLIGKCAYIDGRGVGETFGAFMSVFRSLYNDYVFHVLQSSYIQKQIEETIGATINQLTNKNLNSFDIPFPNTDEQKRIYVILSDMDAEIEALEKKLNKYRMLKQGMMQTLLTGRIRLV